MSTSTMRGEVMFPARYLAADDLAGKDLSVTIAKVEKDKLKTKQADEDKWFLRFREVKKLLVLNKTNDKTIVRLHGKAAENWIGKRITLYPATCDAFGELVDCIRVREQVPPASKAPDVDELPPPDPNEGT